MKGSFLIPSEAIFRDVLIRVNPEPLNLALQQWHAAHGQEGDNELPKQTNEIGMVIPLLDAIAIQGKTITVDALLTQRKVAEYRVKLS